LIRREPNREVGAPASDGTGLATVHAGIAEYYTGKIRKFGATPLGVDWTCVPTQEMRFVQLLKLCDFTSPLSLNDLGCGYGALLSYLDWRHPGCTIDYLGIDLSQAMLRRARRLWRNRSNVSFVHDHASPRLADYSVASGIFNVRLNQPRDLWERFVATALDQLHRTSRRGFSVNFMRAPPVGTPERQGVYSTGPERWAQYCTDQFGAATEVIDGYGLREFTLIVRRPPLSI
jgi:SAM-dependent methyltransferase